MSLHKKIKVVDLTSLQLEQQRLKAVCEVKKVKLEQGLSQLQKNYPEVIMKGLLPFDDHTNDLLYKVAKWLNKTVTDFASTNNTKIVKLLAGKGGNILQGVLVFALWRIGRNILLKKR